MRISDCADLTGTTVRTIRYYHQIGLLPVPEVRGGRRDYGLDHAARILRIRWLAEAGLALEGIAEMFAQRGLLRQPQAIGALIERLDDADIDLVVEFCAVYARIPHQDAATAEESARHLRALIRDWAAQNPSLTADTIAVLPSWMTIGPGIRLLRSFMTLMADDARQARLLRAIVDDLLDHDPEGSTHD